MATNPDFGGTGSSYWKDENTYVGYYTCIPNSRYPCPQESEFPGWKKISEKGVGTGTYGGCPGCAMTEIVWGRINIAPGTPVPAPAKKTVKLSYSVGSLRSSGGWSIDGASYSQYGTIEQTYAESKYGGSGETALKNWLIKEGTANGHFSINDTIYDKNGNLAVIPPEGLPVSYPERDMRCAQGTTRQVPCPKDPNKLVTQECVGGFWVTTKVDEKKCETEYHALDDIAKAVVVGIILVIISFLG